MNLHYIPESDLHFSIIDQLFLDTLLMEKGGIQYPTHHTHNDKKETQLAANIHKLEQNLKEDN